MAELGKSRKSVSFDPDTVVVDGSTTESAALSNDGKTTAEGHSAEPAVEEVTDLFKDLARKKKKSKAAKKEDGEEVDDPDAEKETTNDGIDLSLKKKKKKKPVKADAFEAKLAEVGDAEAKPEEESADAQEGDMIEGTGIWTHDRTDKITYPLLLERFFIQLHDRHPDLTGASLKSTKIPPPQCLREGNKKTIFANLPDIAKRLKRSEDHVTQFLFAELGTSGSVDASRRLVIKGRFQSKQIENILRRYIQDYVSCKTCRSLNTELAKGENRLWYITCQSCGSRRTVPAINRGFHALVGKRKRQQA